MDRDGESGEHHFNNKLAEVASASDPPMNGLSGLADYPKGTTEHRNEPSHEGSDAIVAAQPSVASKPSTDRTGRGEARADYSAE